ncbi:MAG TPA: LAGLIDADG family homing endonuclease, partial [Desulfosporosinus sp.]|nr:LAGLIDADG family homing endonuclease [Desulfosporosinus sp.]
FMLAVREGRPYDLIDPHTGSAVGQLSAPEIFSIIVEHAWQNGEPGIVFLDRLNQGNPTPLLGEIEATNPCVTGDTWILTDHGPAQVKTVLGRELELVLNGEYHRTSPEGFFSTGTKAILSVKTDRGYDLKVTKDHLVRVAEKVTREQITEIWKPAGELKPGDQIILSNNRGLSWPSQGSLEEGYLLGLLLGDGTLKEDGGIISVWGDDEEAQSMISAAEKAASSLRHRSDFKGFQKVISERNEHRMKLAALRDLAGEYGIFPKEKRLTEELEKTSSDFHRGLIRGLFDTDGTVEGSQEKGVSVRLWQKDLAGLQIVQRMLHRLGVASTIYRDRKSSGYKSLPDGKGGHQDYEVQPGHELSISQDNLPIFAEVIGFSNNKKTQILKDRLEGYHRNLNRERFLASVTECLQAGVEEVYDARVPGVNAFDANGIYVHNCGEQPLLPNEACNLGSLNLKLMVTEKDGKMVINWERLSHVTRLSVRFLDNVIDANQYPLSIIDEMVKGNRKIGLGVMGFADMLILLQTSYATEDAVEYAEKIMKFIQTEARIESQRLAEERGTFPNYEGSIYDGVMKLRNATLTTIAPTGTISMICAASSGVEPLFAVAYTKTVMDGTALVEVNPLFEAFAKEYGFYSPELMQKIAELGTVLGLQEVPNWVQEVFTTAQEIAPEWHIRIQAVFQKYTDNAVSKTINFANSATREDIAEAYRLADELNCKGLTVYRDGSREEQVLSTGTKATQSQDDKAAGTKHQQASEQLSAPKVPFIPEVNTVIPRPRPTTTIGVTEKIKIGCGNLYVSVNADEKGICEVFTNTGRAGGCSSQSEATARLISITLRSGLSVDAITEQIKGIRCPACMRREGVNVTSCPDAIARVIKKYNEVGINFASVQKGTQETALAAVKSSVAERERPFREKVTEKIARTGVAAENACPECGMPINHESGCVVCTHCGYSKCG